LSGRSRAAGDNAPASEPIVCEVSKRGKLLVGEPYFDPRTPIVLDRHGAGGAEVGDLVVVRVGKRRASIERVLGSARHVGAVLDGLLYHTGARPLPERDPEAEREADLMPADPSAADDWVDLRSLPTFTIDPDEAMDFDDALSVERDGDGSRLWVHIADVSRYVTPGTALDRDAAARALSVYVPGRVEPMLPEGLANGLCSLLPHRDRACVTVEVPFTAELEPGEPTFYRSLIRSRERLTYSHAQAILTGRERAGSELGDALHLAERLSAALRRRRYRRGALRIDTGEIAFELDGNEAVARAWVETEPLAHALVEELMILANEAVAKLLSSRRRESLYRVHERPEPQAIELLLAKLEALEVPTPAAPDRLAPSDAARLAARVSARVAEYTAQSGRGAEAFPALVLRSLKQARYDPRNLGHSGLASQAYCHFTSPIRRYPDLICHRALLAELDAFTAPPLPPDLPELAEWASVREREAAQVEYAADAICLAWLLERRLFDLGWDADLPGEIIGVIGSGIFVRFDEVFEGYLPARRLPNDYFEPDALATALVGRRRGRRFRLGDSIRITVEGIDRASGKVNLALCEKNP
jgi:ribonuclease R